MITDERLELTVRKAATNLGLSEEFTQRMLAQMRSIRDNGPPDMEDLRRELADLEAMVEAAKKEIK